MICNDAAEVLPRAPLNCFWEITEACNLRCIHCELEAGLRDRDELSTQEALDFIDQLADCGGRIVNLTGGEPLIRSDWPLIAKHLVKRGLTVNIITNGLSIDDETIEQMVEVGVSGVSVSIDGTREVHDAIRLSVRRNAPSHYDISMAALHRLCDSPLQTSVITQVHKQNIDDLEWMYRNFADMGIDVWQVQLAIPLGRLFQIQHTYLLKVSKMVLLQEKLSRFIQDNRIRIAVGDNIGYYGQHESILRGALTGKENFWRGCLAGIRVVGIRSNGDVKGCPSFQSCFVSGNIRKEPFSKIWADESRFIYNTGFREEQLVGKCARCPLRRICRAGCTSMAYAVAGTIFDNPYCVLRDRIP